VRVQQNEAEMDARTYGGLLHSVLGGAHCELRRRGLLPLRPQVVQEALQIALSLVDALLDDEQCPGSLSEKRVAGCRLKQMVAGLLNKEACEGSGLTPTFSEIWVGGRDGVDVGGVRIRGRLDRVDADVARDTLFIIDYKSGGVPSAASIGTEKALQLPLYVMALSAERPEAVVIGGAYLSASDCRRSGIVSKEYAGLLGGAAEGCRELDAEQQEHLRSSTLEASLSAVASIRSGVIAPRAGRSCPSWCEYGSVCRLRSGGYRR
jgi:hypothetical protein